MGWSESAKEGFPPQRHREPMGLRRDIVDELADHLAFAAAREAESGVVDDGEIRERVLEQFGDPTAVARALWWDAMREIVMKDWIQISVNVVLCVGVMGFMTLFYRQMQSTNTALIEALNDRPSAADALYPSAEFVLHRGSVDGPVAAGVEVSLIGKVFTEEDSDIEEVSDARGHVKFGPVRAGRYGVEFRDDETGLSRSAKIITLYPGDGTKTYHVAVPPTTQVPLDVKAPLAERLSSKGIRLLTSIDARWSYEREYWYGRSKEVLVTCDGIFEAKRNSNGGHSYQAGARITQTFGTHVAFDGLQIVKSKDPDQDGDEWLLPYISIRYSSGRYDLEADGANSIVFDLSDEQLASYDRGARQDANRNHGLPERFSWFPDVVAEEYSEYVIDEAQLVEKSLGYYFDDTQYTVTRPSVRDVLLSERSGHLFSLENAPNSIPDGYKLLLAVKRINTTATLKELDANLCAFLDSSASSYDLEEDETKDLLAQTGEPVWKLDAESLVALGRAPLFIDLTDAVNDTSFENTSGILLGWETLSRNSIAFRTPESSGENEQPVWLVMKPWAGLGESGEI